MFKTWPGVPKIKWNLIANKNGLDPEQPEIIDITEEWIGSRDTVKVFDVNNVDLNNFSGPKLHPSRQ